MTTHTPATVSVPRLKDRGWTTALIRDFLGEPDWLVKKPHYSTAAPIRLYALERVEKAENNPHWQRRHAGGKGSQRAIPADEQPTTIRTVEPVYVRDLRMVATDSRKAIAIAQATLGVSINTIADELGVKPSTVRGYIKRPKPAPDPERERLLRLARQQKEQQEGERRDQLRYQRREEILEQIEAGKYAEDIADIIGMTPLALLRFCLASNIVEHHLKWREQRPKTKRELKRERKR